MERNELPAIRRRMEKRSYKNFDLAIYCPVANVNMIKDFEDFDRRFNKAFKNVKVGRVYLEDFRGYETCDREHLIKVKEYFENKGIATSGGITTCASHNPKFGFASLCYSDEEAQKYLKEAVELNAEIFDEFIFDDFYFINCRCPKCIEKKGARSWKEFRLEQKKWVTEELIMKPAKAIRPDVNVIVKFPQWFEDFNETGYDLATDTTMFDSIYTGTETRNPTYSQQHLPKYLSYNTMRLYGSDAPGHNLGGWFDPYECTYNLTSYTEQAYLTLFAKAPEVTLFCLGSLMMDPQFRVFPSVVGEALEEADEYLGELGNPIGAGAYHPSYGRGENNIHSYLGQCGIPMEMTLLYPENSQAVFLAESAAADRDIVNKMKKTLLSGNDVIVTSGFVSALGEEFKEFGNVSVTSKKALVDTYSISLNSGVNLEGLIKGTGKIMIPQLDYNTNDVWEIAAAYGNDNNFPIVLSWSYGDGVISVVTIPDDMGDLYCYPGQVLKSIRDLFIKETKISTDAPAQVLLFPYDNNMLIVRSDLPNSETIKITLPEGATELRNHFFRKALGNNMERQTQSDGSTANSGKRTEVTISVIPGINQVYEIV